MPRKAKPAGGAPEWMVTFGDLMSILVCFFVLLISFSIQDTKKLQVVAGSMKDAFGTTKSRLLTGVIEKDGNPVQEDVAQADPAAPRFAAASSLDQGVSSQAAEGQALSAAAGLSDSADDQRYALAAASIRQAWQADPQLTPYQDNLIVQKVPEGLEIVIADQKGRRMFPEASKYPTEPTRRALAALGPVLAQLGEPLRISGHTAAGTIYANPRYGAWELSSDRANVTRSTLQEFGVPGVLMDSVTGRAEMDPFFPNDPYLDANERVQILIQQREPPLPPGFGF